MENLITYLPLLIPVIVLELILMITALIHLLRHPNYRCGNRVIWILVVLFLQILGPILYFVIGREDS
ncbi:MAG: PLDc N-terminal domain-containing protein [Candidatus Pararuminococcus gallinarum]|jgi:hypothetical protein|uniref:PLDc N-terminal domain-containing protein n=1 Tax=Zongyangia sp. HA2173 TaxID=3133035 RepID=UPI00174E7EEB